MERITTRDCHGVAIIPTVPEKEGQKRDLGEHAKRLRAAISRLAAYEDTGFTPEAIITMRGELCLKCGRYTDAHLGACNGCRWRKEV